MSITLRDYQLDVKNKIYQSWNAGNIKYYAVCFAYKGITCKSIRGKRENSKHFCLDDEIIIKEIK